MEIEIGGLTPGAEFDVLTIEPLLSSDDALLDGSLHVVLIDNFVPSLGSSFTILETTAGTVDGVFANEILPVFNGLTFDVIYNAQSVMLEVVEATGIPGDFNNNGAVENADLTLLLNNWGEPVPPTPAGWLGIPLSPPAVDNDELTALLNNWGATAGRGSARSSPAPAAVPEPSTVALVMLALLVARSISRRRTGQKGH